MVRFDARSVQARLTCTVVPAHRARGSRWRPLAVVRTGRYESSSSRAPASIWTSRNELAARLAALDPRLRRCCTSGIKLFRDMVKRYRRLGIRKKPWDEVRGQSLIQCAGAARGPPLMSEPNSPAASANRARQQHPAIADRCLCAGGTVSSVGV